MASETLAFFESVVGKNHVIVDEQKLNYGKDYTKYYTPDPLAAVLPATTEEVSKILKYCNERGIAVVPSGGRTGLSAGAVAKQQEVVVSTERMKKIFGINKTEKTIHCQGGVVTKEVQKAAWDAGLYFPVDFGSSGSSQIGGNVATNAGGIKVIRYGLIRDWVLGLQAVLADGTVLDMKNACLKNNTGYDLKHFFVGSEGTLGIITEVLLNLTVQPGPLMLSMFGLQTLEHVTQLFTLAQEHRLNMTAYEYYSEFALLRVQEHLKIRAPFQQTYPFYVLLEVEKASADDETRLEKFVESGMEKGLILDGVLSQNSQQASEFWALRETIAEALSVLTVPHKNDISLPLSGLTAFCTDLQKLIAENYPGVEVVSFGHIGDGNLHVNFIKPEKMSKDEFFKQAKLADVAMFNLVRKYGGSISAEHGVGLTKKPFLEFTRSPEEIQLMKGIKRVFDPKGILNPGKIFDL